MRSISHYGKSKFLSTKFIQKKIKNYIILRPYQIYGPYQKINRLIPLVINSCLKNKSLIAQMENNIEIFYTWMILLI